MGSSQDYAINNTLSSGASSPSYTQGLDSLMYNTLGVPRPSDRIPFVVSTVDEAGQPQIYTIDDTTISIVGLTLSVNPASVSVNMSKLISRTQTMTGWLEEHWGEELDTIAFQGSTAGFIFQPPTYMNTGADAESLRAGWNTYSNQPDTGNIGAGPNRTSGLATALRRETASYREFKKIINLMNSNAASFNSRGFIKNRLYIEMSYDYACYRGYFESIDVTEDAASPFRFQYTITFKAEKTIFKFSGNPVSAASTIDMNLTGSQDLNNIGMRLDLSLSLGNEDDPAVEKPVISLPIDIKPEIYKPVVNPYTNSIILATPLRSSKPLDALARGAGSGGAPGRGEGGGELFQGGFAGGSAGGGGASRIVP